MGKGLAERQRHFGKTCLQICSGHAMYQWEKHLGTQSNIFKVMFLVYPG